METGYKGFKVELKNNKEFVHCRHTEYKHGEKMFIPGKPEMCWQGFHFCKKIEDVQIFYPLVKKFEVWGIIFRYVVYGEVKAYNKIIHNSNKSCTNTIKIKRFLENSETLTLLKFKKYKTSKVFTNITYDKLQRVEFGITTVLFNSSDLIAAHLRGRNWKREALYSGEVWYKGDNKVLLITNITKGNASKRYKGFTKIHAK